MGAEALAPGLPTRKSSCEHGPQWLDIGCQAWPQVQDLHAAQHHPDGRARAGTERTPCDEHGAYSTFHQFDVVLGGIMGVIWLLTAFERPQAFQTPTENVRGPFSKLLDLSS